MVKKLSINPIIQSRACYYSSRIAWHVTILFKPSCNNKLINRNRFCFNYVHSCSSSSCTFRIRPSALFPIRIILDCCSYRQLAGFLGQGISPVARPLCIEDSTAQIQKKRRQTSMRQVGFEPIIPVFDRTKTFYALDFTATVIGSIITLIL